MQVLADQHGNVIHLGERSSSLQHQNQKLIAETPAPSLTPEQRQHLWQMAVELTRLFGYQHTATVEFLVDRSGRAVFSDFKGRIQVEHPVTEMVSGVDIVAEQIAIAAGLPLRLRQEEVQLRGWAMQCRINAEDPWNHFLPSPGRLMRFRLPAGQHVRVDTYGYSGCMVTERYDSLLAKVIVWAEDRPACLQTMRRALQDFIILGVQTNLPLHQRILDHPGFVQGDYDMEVIHQALLSESDAPVNLRDIAIAAAVAYERRIHASPPALPERLNSGWHRSARQLPG